MISVALACCTRDADQAIRVLEWTAELGPVPTNLYIFCSADCPVQRMVDLGWRSFMHVKWCKDYEEINSNWHEVGNHLKSAAGPNSLFKQAAFEFCYTVKTPWLFWEPDAIPCRRDWFRLISDEYQNCGKPFMGYEVTRKTHPGDVGHHMSGVAVYPYNVPELANRSVQCGDTAFDIEAAEQIIPQMHPSRTIFHRYRPPEFETQEDFEQRVPESLALYHANKSGSIFPFLRKRLGMVQLLAPTVREVQLAEPLPSKQIVAGSIPVTHSTTIFVKSREHDYDWLRWCIRSIEKYASGFRSLGVLCDDFKYPEWSEECKFDGVWLSKPAKEPGYLWQQVCKLCFADEYSDSDFILFMDSDCVFTRNVTPEEFIKDGKPVWQYTPLDQARPDQHVWTPVMERFLGKKPEHEFMRRHPFIVPRWAFEELRTFCKYRHGKSLEDYIMGEADVSNELALKFSEWNCLGFFLWEYHRERIHWVTDSDAGPACVYQGFTHGGEQRKQEDLAKFREILGEDGIRAEGEPPTSRAIPAVSTPVLTESAAIEFLASQVKNNFHKARIIKQLKKAWQGKGEVSNKKNGYSIAPTVHIPPTGSGAKAVKYNGLLLCIHSYPGANETMARHWPNFNKFGATRIAGIGTTDGKCTWPDGLDTVVDIGQNSYMKMKGKDDHLCRRLLDTVKWCLTQPEDHFAIVEYDTLILRKFPHFSGIHAHLTGGQVNGSKTKHFYHNPWLFDRASGEKLAGALEAVLPDSAEYPNNSPDLFFGLAVERAQIEVKCNFKLFTRNSIDNYPDLELAVDAAVNGFHAIHGVKDEIAFQAIQKALNDLHLALSHVA